MNLSHFYRLSIDFRAETVGKLPLNYFLGSQPALHALQCIQIFVQICIQIGIFISLSSRIKQLTGLTRNRENELEKSKQSN